ncbi:hypothetical protein C0Q70_07755 [Pomacea canaliculata]|uniref:AAA+ ATPase domain-containing protein n=1 Tax=Pomacea canaliculata TaxID=400727 RepID=A0A2T7PFY8_POMCA|nr:hypothetical protein C0Q70_07755 [Pomacea canaliculata]
MPLFFVLSQGVGKTTLVQKVCAALKENHILTQGFYTEEVRSGGRRTGFDVVTLSGNRGPLARVSGGGQPQETQRHEPRVGQYSVKLQAFEQTALPVLKFPNLAGEKPVMVIDEIGKMEMFSGTFTQTVRTLIAREDATVLATIPIAKGQPLPLVEELRTKKDAYVFTISKENRNSILSEIAAAVQLSIKT